VKFHLSIMDLDQCGTEGHFWTGDLLKVLG